MRDVVIAGYLRTPFSKSRPTKPEVDWFHKIRADELMRLLLPELVKRTGVEPEAVEDFIIGCALGVNEQWTYGGRTPLFMADLSAKTPAKFIDQQCGSSMAALHTGFMEIAMGSANIVLAAGMEHMTRIPIGPTLYESGLADLNPALAGDPAYKHWDIQTTMNMGLTAENLFAQTSLSREDMDRWAVRSHNLASDAQQKGYFDDEILPVEAEQADGTMLRVDKDQCVRANADLESTASLKPAFREDGVITAGNSSPLNAGASGMILMSREEADKRNIHYSCRIRSAGFAGVDPTIMGLGPIPAARRALETAGLTPADIDFWEINEAFAVVVLNMINEMKLDPERVNIKGGALAIGHAMGATGIRLTGTLARTLEETGTTYGCAAACIGGGQGTATVIERIP